MIFNRFGDTKCFAFFSFIRLCFFGIFSFIDSSGFIRMFTGAGAGGSSGGTVGEGEERGDVRGEEEEIMEGEERRGEDDAWLEGLIPPPMFDLLLWKENVILYLSQIHNIVSCLILKYLLTLGPEDEGLS